MKNWEILFDKAMAALDSLSSANPPPEVSFGGGTALMLRYDHRESHDIDLFFTDTQLLLGLSPRLNDATEQMTDDYVEDARALKLRFGDLGEVDFIAAPRLVPGSATLQVVNGRSILVDEPVEIVAKKCFYRASFFKARDIFDLCVFLRNDAAEAERNRGLLLHKRDELSRRLSAYESNPSVYRKELSMLDIFPAYESLRDQALPTVKEFVG